MYALNWYLNTKVELTCFISFCIFLGRPVNYSASADHMRDDGEIFASVENLKPDADGRVQFKEAKLYNIRWKILIFLW